MPYRRQRLFGRGHIVRRTVVRVNWKRSSMRLSLVLVVPLQPHRVVSRYPIAVGGQIIAAASNLGPTTATAHCPQVHTALEILNLHALIILQIFKKRDFSARTAREMSACIRKSSSQVYQGK